MSHNALGSLAGVETCANVRCLLAHANAIGKAQGASRREPDSRRGDAPALAPLGGLAKLEELWLSHNELAKPSELLRLGPLGPSLKVLRLRPNACCEASVIDRYRALLCGLLPRLRHLDDEAVTAAERSDGDAYVVSTDGRVAVHKLKAEGREIDATHAKATAVARKQEAKIVARPQERRRLEADAAGRAPDVAVQAERVREEAEDGRPFSFGVFFCLEELASLHAQVGTKIKEDHGAAGRQRAAQMAGDVDAVEERVVGREHCGYEQ